jgi:hypothetical protein
MIQLYFAFIKYDTNTFVVRPYTTNDFFAYNPSLSTISAMQIEIEKAEVQ